MSKECIYKFEYNDMIYESSSYTISVHKTREGAERAMSNHKKEKKKELSVKYQLSSEAVQEALKHKAWYVTKIDLLD